MIPPPHGIVKAFLPIFIRKHRIFHRRAVILKTEVISLHYTCEICGYSTEPAEETPSNWEPSWCCPVCGSDGELFYPEDEEDIR